MVKEKRTYPSGEPMDYGLVWVVIAYLVLITLFIISFVLAGQGGVLFGLILLATRLLLIATVLASIGAAGFFLWKKKPKSALMAVWPIPVAVLGLLVLSPL